MSLLSYTTEDPFKAQETEIRRSAEQVREWERANPGYKITYPVSTFGSGTPMCKHCGAAVLDIELHDGWHFGGAA